MAVTSSGARPALPRPRPGVVVALGLALIWSLGLVAAAFLVPVYTGSGAGSGTGGGGTTATLVQVNGVGVLGVVLAPLVTTLVVAAMIVLRPRYPIAGTLAWVAAIGLVLLALAGLTSIGLFMLPVAFALVVAVILSRRSQPG